MNPYATSEDVEARWRPLPPAEHDLADTLAGDASDMIRSRWPDIDARIASSAVSSSTLLRIVASMVKRAMINRDLEGITQGSETVGPFSHSASYANPSGNLYLSADDIATLNGFGYVKRATMSWLD